MHEKHEESSRKVHIQQKGLDDCQNFLELVEESGNLDDLWQ